ncbi:hypothetical protein Tco_0693362 [Tanacetum coccineum]
MPEKKFCRRPTAKVVGLRVADSHTGNHPEDGFTPLETIRRLLVVIGRRSHSSFEGEAFEPDRMVRGMTVSGEASVKGEVFSLTYGGYFNPFPPSAETLGGVVAVCWYD